MNPDKTLNTPSQAGRSALRSQLLFALSSTLLLLAITTLSRLALLLFNHEMVGNASLLTILEGFGNGVRFDLRVVVIIVMPLWIILLSRSGTVSRSWQRWWLTLCASLLILLSLIELNFYQEFHQRLNSLVFQYLKEDPATVLSMLWHGFPVLKLLSVWALVSYAVLRGFTYLDLITRASPSQVTTTTTHWGIRLAVVTLCLLISVVAGRGTLRQGPPLRWGDAFTTNSVFINHLGLNGALTLSSAIRSELSDHRDNLVTAVMPEARATELTRSLLLGKGDQLIDQDQAAVRRITKTLNDQHLPIRNVVVILMESFAGRFVGALGSDAEITPNFDRLTREGLLFRRFFSNGTHTHQGMFATMACFPNLPGFEYLMQTPEGGHQFSGLPQLLSQRQFNDVYVYNGDFSWDNQRGFFSNQGMTHFVGRHDYQNPTFFDPTWGVSDQDMFDRANQELELLAQQPKPFYAFLQTLSNHSPFALPEKLPVDPVTDQGFLNEHLTAMRYSDWALGRFFEQARHQPYFNETLFVIVGDHGFGTPDQLTEMDLHRFHVPLLMIAPGIQQAFGEQFDAVGSQVDIVPTILGRLDNHVQHQCWGRDLLSLPAQDEGFAVIKPSGGDQSAAIIQGDQILVKPKDQSAHLYRYDLQHSSTSSIAATPEVTSSLSEKLLAYLQTATISLQRNTTGMHASP